MVPYSVFWESLGFFFAKYFFMFGVFTRECGFGRGGNYGARFTEKDLFLMDGSRLVDRLWQELCFHGIGCFKDDRELSMVDPASFPIDFWLHCSKPGIS